MKKTFKELQGVIINPYIGFTSFQHFRGEKLYSDCITGRSGIAGSETENYECFPVPDGVEEKGREQGYYPDNTVAYIRILWKEFEPERGEYNYAIIENILARAKEKGQTVMFRLMPHSTCERDDVPEWLKEMMDCPARPAGMRVKDSPTDPRYLKLFGQAVEKLGERFDCDETFDCIDVSLGGAWGEGSQAFPDEAMKEIMDIYIRVFPNTKLYGQLSNISMLKYISEKRPIGWRADGTGSPKHMNELFPPRIAQLKSDHWKYAPVSFESYWWISEWYRQGWDIDSIIEKTLSWHVSTFNAKSFPIQFELKEKVEYWLTRMGYRFHLKEIYYPEKLILGENLEVSFTIDNKGVAPIYNRLPFRFIITNGSDSFDISTEIDIRKWMPGKTVEKVSMRLPDGVKKGKYQIFCAIGGGKYPIVKLASETENDGERYYLADVEVI